VQGKSRGEKESHYSQAARKKTPITRATQKKKKPNGCWERANLEIWVTFPGGILPEKATLERIFSIEGYWSEGVLNFFSRGGTSGGMKRFPRLRELGKT